MMCRRVYTRGLAFFAAFASLVASSVLFSSAQAGSLATTSRALNDGLGPDLGVWRGAANISVPPVFPPSFNDEVTAVVSWAAFAPGDFQLYLNDEGIAAVDPSAPLEVVYAYQIDSVSAVSPGISTLTVGVDSTDGRGSVLAPSFVPAGGATEVAPTGGGDGVTQMQWFFGSLLQVGDTTGILVFSSPFAPELGNLQVSSGVASPVPSPQVATISDRIFEHNIPEPSAIALLLIGAIGPLVFSRRSN